ncbi:MAG: DUF5050 domain-containing protein [Clostridiales Family XIII bacterium]|nr:DUF5050 domain-containing protein [Clostridiales Family XIII bacterium]
MSLMSRFPKTNLTELSEPHRVPRLIPITLLLILLCTACSNIRTDDAENEQEPEAFRTVSVTLDARQIEKLSLPQSRICSQISLSIKKLKNGVFYGLGHGPSGDGYREFSFYKFDFNGNVSENIDDARYFYMEPVEYPEGSNVFYCLSNEKNSPSKKLARIDFNNFQEETLMDLSEESPDESAEFCVDGRSVYYLNDEDHSVRQATFDGGKKIKLFESAKNLISDKRNNTFCFLNDEGNFCIYDLSSGKFNETGRLGDEIMKMSGPFGNRLNDGCLYYTRNDAGVARQYVYDIDSGEKRVAAESTSCDDGRPAFSKPCFMGTRAGILSYAQNTIYIWDSKKNKTVERLAIGHDKIDQLIGAYENRYFTYSAGDKLLGIIDTETRTDYVLDISALAGQTKGSVDFWFLEGNYLYAQDVCEWDVGADSPDEFYRIDIAAAVGS